MTPRNFDLALRKGAIGEEIVREYLESKGWVVYQPITEGAHCFDMLSIKDKRSAVALDVKAKAALRKWPATGVNLRHFNEYLRFSEKHSMPFYIVFVDEWAGQVYGSTLENLEKKRMVEGVEYPFVKDFAGTPTRVWPLEAMTQIATLGDKHVEALMGASQRSYDYADQPLAF